MLRLISSEKLKGVNDYSALSRRQIAEFLSSLGKGSVSSNRICDFAEMLGFEKHEPIPLGDVQKFYILLSMKEMYVKVSYKKIAKTFLPSTIEQGELNDYWVSIEEMGALSKQRFWEALGVFYRKTQN